MLFAITDILHRIVDKYIIYIDFHELFAVLISIQNILRNLFAK